MSDPKPARSGADLHVTVNGNDAWSGLLPAPNATRTNGPFATLERARDEIRQWKHSGRFPAGGVTVYLGGGTYPLDRPFALGPDDSGTEAGPVVWRAVEGQQVHITGGKRIAGWTPFRDGILRADVRARAGVRPQGLDALRGDPTSPILSFELFFDGRRMDLTRWPNHDPSDPHDGTWAYIAGVPSEPAWTTFNVIADKARLAAWAAASDAQVHIFPRYDWSDQYIGIEHVNPDSGTITLASKTSYDIAPGRRFIVRNVLAELDAPGEWYFDRAANVVYFKPPAPIEGHEVWASHLDNLVVIEGAEHLMLRGFVLECCRGDAAIIRGGRNVSLAACTIRNAGAYGARIDGGTENGVVGCDVSETGGGGVTFSGGDRKTLTPGNNYVLNCHIHHYGRLRKCYSGAANISGCGNRIAHNLIHDAPHNAILLHGNDHVIEFNEIHDVVQETQDAGAFYMGRDWSERGNVIRYNSFHDIYGYGFLSGDPATGVVRYASPKFVWPVYLDDNASGTLVYGNVFYRCPNAAVMIGGGKDNVVENNVFVECYPAVHVDARWEGFFKPDSLGGVGDYMRRELAAVNYDQPPYSTAYPTLPHALDEERLPARNRIARNVISYARDDIRGFDEGAQAPGIAMLWHLIDYDPASTVVDSNLVWHFGQPVRVQERPFLQGDPQTISREAWQAKGYDKASRIAEPGFVDPANDDYRLRDGSPAFALGFERIPIDQIGLYRDELRASWPVDRAERRGDLSRMVYTYRLSDLGPGAR